LIELFPRDYQDRSNIVPICEIENYGISSIKGFLAQSPENYKIKSLCITKIKIKDATGVIEIVWYNQPYMKNNFKKGVEYIFTGRVKEKYNNLKLESPEYEVYDENTLLSNARIVPIYKLPDKITQKRIRTIMKKALDCVEENIEDFIPQIIRKKFDLCTRSFAIYNIHFPNSDEDFIKARNRLVFEEVFIMQLMLLKIKNLKKVKSSANIQNLKTDSIVHKIKFNLTKSQNKVVKEIITDLKEGLVINRLIQGDVGSGKTIVAIIISFLIAQNGMQVAIMVPTEVLAKQHYNSFLNFFEPKYKTVLLTGSLKKKEKEEAYLYIKNGDAKIVIGTHAIIQEGVIFNNLALIITDEQHRFGVKQREALSQKGHQPHVLLMTATPIPRTLAIILYGDMDISIIDELPAGRKAIDTYCVASSYRQRIYTFIKKEIDKGRQAYIVCPMVEESETMELEAVAQYTEKIRKEMVKYNIEYLHGKMKPKEKQEVMDNFAKGFIDIIVSTTVIEVGINVPNANVIVIENAERFGLSQLHQLRGRVGRGQEKSYCILITDAKSKVSKQRMEAIVNNTDGFLLSDLDLKLRGSGDFFGTNQHGLPNFKIANMYKDMKIVKEAIKATKFLQENINDSNEEIKNMNNEISKLLQKFNKITL
jgi:ATP-dependent DNA helicase RecG